MSLEQLRDLRRKGHRPAFADVIIGRPGKRFQDGPNQVVVTRDGMDLSPLVGMRLYVLDMQRDIDMTLRVVGQLQQLQTVLVGAYGHYGPRADTPEVQLYLRRCWEALCPTE